MSKKRKRHLKKEKERNVVLVDLLDHKNNKIGNKIVSKNTTKHSLGFKKYGVYCYYWGSTSRYTKNQLKELKIVI